MHLILNKLSCPDFNLHTVNICTSVSSSGKCKDVIGNEQLVNIGVILLFMLNSSCYHSLVTRILVSHKVLYMGDMESSSRIALHSLLKDLGEIRRLGNRGMMSGKPGKGATKLISCSITEITMLMPRSLWKLSTALVRSPVRFCT